MDRGRSVASLIFVVFYFYHLHGHRRYVAFLPKVRCRKRQIVSLRKHCFLKVGGSVGPFPLNLGLPGVPYGHPRTVHSYVTGAPPERTAWGTIGTLHPSLVSPTVSILQVVKCPLNSCRFSDPFTSPAVDGETSREPLRPGKFKVHSVVGPRRWTVIWGRVQVEPRGYLSRLSFGGPVR